MAPAFRLRHRADAALRAHANRDDPANELDDAARALVEATTRLRWAAASPWPTVAASLGCVKAALDQLADTAADKGLHASTRIGGRQSTSVRDLFERLRLQLTLAQSTAGAARESAGPLLSRQPEEGA